MAKQITLTLKSLTAAVTDLEKIVAEVKSSAGTAAQRNKAARDAVIADVKVKIPTLPADKGYQSVTAWLDSVKATADQALDEAVTAELRKSKDDGATGLAALRESFKSKAETATALRTMLIAAKVTGAEAVTIPTLKGAGGGPTSTSGAKVSNVQWFIVRADGSRKEMPTSQNKPSSVAWYHGAEIGVPDCTGNKGKGCSKEEMFSFLKAAGADVKAGEAWSFETATGVTIGMDVKPEA